MPITISIVEDDRATRDTLMTLLNGEEGMQCISGYGSGEEAVQAIPRDKPQVALVDINLPGMSGIECVAGLKARMPELDILILTTYEESNLIFSSLRAGAKGYLLKKTILTELIPAIEQVRAGGAPMSMQIARKVVEHFHAAQKANLEIEKLTRREQEILALLSKGCLYKEIGDQLGISVTTVRTHLKHIYEKLHVQSRTEAAVKYLGRE